ncbi:hypothetical protein EVAR_103960_1 [Eumeta japonica]|uniref:Uncharacterized protein n=1 Tax=Eumeta variegata TaxID=151549 RepID=A0A4C1YCD7_EUMVA|nr:hypothetical protein EVAR_103960_1 [Eumeta japonica]
MNYATENKVHSRMSPRRLRPDSHARYTKALHVTSTRSRLICARTMRAAEQYSRESGPLTHFFGNVRRLPLTAGRAAARARPGHC